jgi:hypothetical protein
LALQVRSPERHIDHVGSEADAHITMLNLGPRIRVETVEYRTLFVDSAIDGTAAAEEECCAQ